MRFKFINYFLILLIVFILAVSSTSAANDDYKMSTVSFDGFSIDLPYGSYFNETDISDGSDFLNYTVYYENKGLYNDKLVFIAYCSNVSMEDLNTSDANDLVVISTDGNSVLYEAPDEMGMKYVLTTVENKDLNSKIIMGGNDLDLMRNASASIKFDNKNK